MNNTALRAGVQRALLREKLEAFKVKAAGTEKQENRKEKGKEVTM